MCQEVAGSIDTEKWQQKSKKRKPNTTQDTTETIPQEEMEQDEDETKAEDTRQQNQPVNKSPQEKQHPDTGQPILE